jgi:hypothetical protein
VAYHASARSSSAASKSGHRTSLKCSSFAAGADQQVGIGCERQREVPRDVVFGQRRRAGAGALLGRAARRLGDVPAAAVIGAYREVEPGVVPGLELRLGDLAAQLRVEGRHVADHADPDAELDQLADLAPQRADEQLHQRRHLVGGTAPVLGTEREQRQVLDAAFPAGLQRGAHGVDAAGVPEHARLAPGLRPAAVAVHDDGDVPRHKRRRRVAGRQGIVAHESGPAVGGPRPS